MSVLNDPRVVQVNQYYYAVEGPAAHYDVSACREPLGAWEVAPSLGSPEMHAANLRNHDEAEEWVEQRTTRHDSLEAAVTYALTRVGVR